jgi:hypothetical protein
MKIPVPVQVYSGVLKRQVAGTVHIEIDVARLAHVLAQKAMGNKNRKTRFAAGKIKAELILRVEDKVAIAEKLATEITLTGPAALKAAEPK